MQLLVHEHTRAEATSRAMNALDTPSHPFPFSSPRQLHGAHSQMPVTSYKNTQRLQQQHRE